MTFFVQRVRSLLVGAALAAFTLVGSACSSSTSSSTSTVAVPTSPAASVAPSTTVSATTPGTGTTVLDANAALASAVAALGAGYHFTSTVTVNGAQSLQANGDRIGANSRLTLTSDGGVVSYIITAAGSYAQPEGGDWSLLDVPPATSDPIAALSAPKVVTVLSTSPLTLKVTVDATTLGVSASGTADVQVVLTSGALTQVTYSAATAAGLASVVTVLGPVKDSTPIVAPV